MCVCACECVCTSVCVRVCSHNNSKRFIECRVPWPVFRLTALDRVAHLARPSPPVYCANTRKCQLRKMLDNGYQFPARQIICLVWQINIQYKPPRAAPKRGLISRSLSNLSRNCNCLRAGWRISVRQELLCVNTRILLSKQSTDRSFPTRIILLSFRPN